MRSIVVASTILQCLSPSRSIGHYWSRQDTIVRNNQTDWSANDLRVGLKVSWSLVKFVVYWKSTMTVIVWWKELASCQSRSFPLRFRAWPNETTSGTQSLDFQTRTQSDGGRLNDDFGRSSAIEGYHLVSQNYLLNIIIDIHVWSIWTNIISRNAIRQIVSRIIIFGLMFIDWNAANVFAGIWTRSI